jgi:hypothetical protein
VFAAGGQGPGAGRTDPVLVAYSIALLVGAGHAVVAARPGASLLATMPYLLAGASYVLVRRSVEPSASAEGPVPSILAVGGAAVAVWVLVRFAIALPDSWGQPHGFYRLKVAVTTPVGDHNTVAGTLLVTTVASVVLFDVHDRRTWALAALNAIGIAATLSRGAAVVLVVLAVASSLSRELMDRRRSVLLLGLAGAVAGSMLVLAGVLDASPPPGSPEGAGAVGASVVGRVDLAERGIEVGLDQPLTGVGPGAFGAVAGDLPPPNDHAHQLFAHAFAEGGLPLLAVAGLLPVLLVIRARHLGPSRTRALVLVGGAALVLHAQFEILGGRLAYEVPLALLLGAVTASRGRAPESSPSRW